MKQSEKAAATSTMNQMHKKLHERADIVARTVISQQPFYASASCTANQRQLLETMVGAAIWYFPQGEDLWTGAVSVAALTVLGESLQPKKVKLTKDHHYPRKFSAMELFNLDWSAIESPAEEVTSRYLERYGQFNYVLPEENKQLVKYQRSHTFVSPSHAYQEAGIELRTLSKPLLKAILGGERELAGLIIEKKIE